MNQRDYAAKLRTISFILVCVAVASGCAAPTKQPKPAIVPEIRPGFLAGYLDETDLPDSKALLPPPPAEGSAAKALDEEISRKALSLSGTPRWSLATQDAELSFPEAAIAFSCALNVSITEQETPSLYRLLRRTLADAGLATSSAKHQYNRKRPFMVNKEPTCSPEWDEHLRKDGSYPSGHTAIGWAWALVLSEIAPDRVDEIIARGRAYGQSRVVCNVHWQSDVNAGRFIAAATVARLHANPTFNKDLKAAKAEIATARTKGLHSTRDCEAETEALALF